MYELGLGLAYGGSGPEPLEDVDGLSEGVVDAREVEARIRDSRAA